MTIENMLCSYNEFTDVTDDMNDGIMCLLASHKGVTPGYFFIFDSEGIQKQEIRTTFSKEEVCRNCKSLARFFTFNETSRFRLYTKHNERKNTSCGDAVIRKNHFKQVKLDVRYERSLNYE